MAKSAEITYQSYLDLDRLLNAQKPVSPAHDEMMFIVVHQAYELWFKLILTEMDRAQDVLAGSAVRDEELRQVSAAFSRIVAILRLIIQQMDIMETMTPLDFLDFRHVFRTASGFQSRQFREIEIRLGLLNEQRASYDGKPYDHYLDAASRESLQALQGRATLVSQIDQWLARTPFVEMGGYDFWSSYREAVAQMIDADRAVISADDKISGDTEAQERKKLDAMQAQFDALFAESGDAARAQNWRLSRKALRAALFINLYRDQPALQMPFKILNELMDIDELLALWRMRHALMAQRMLGTKMGSGGSSGHDYLAATSAHRIFRDLFALSTFLIPRSKLPPLPPEVADKMSFRYWSDGHAA